MRKKLLTTLMALLPIIAFSQEITLDSCINAAKQNWPAFKKQLSITEQRNLIEETLNKNYLPKLNLSGQATYQSETVTFPDVPAMPGLFPVFPNDNYNIELNLNQVIWDGGKIKSEKEMQFAANDIEVQKLNIETYGLTGKINQLYTNYLYLTKSREVLTISLDQLTKTVETLSSALKNGIILKSELDNIKAEKLKIEKELITVKVMKQNTLQSLKLITGLDLDTTYNFGLPQTELNSTVLRPEVALLDAQLNYTLSTVSKFKTSRMPRFFAFAKAGYGRPGFDFMNTNMHTYAIVGAKFTWDIFDWNMFKKQKQNILLQTQIIRDNKATLQKQISLEEQQYLSEISQYRQQVELDKEIIRLKESVYKTAESQMNNGTITSTEYLKLFNEWKMARLTSELDRLKLITAQLNYKYAQGVE